MDGVNFRSCSTANPLAVRTVTRDRAALSCKSAAVAPNLTCPLHLQAYEWPPPWVRKRQTGGHVTASAKPPDIWDTMYLNTFCPKEKQGVTKSVSPAKSAPPRTRLQSFTVTDTRASSRLESLSRPITAINQQEKHGILTGAADRSPINLRQNTLNVTCKQKQQRVELPENTEKVEGADMVHTGSQGSGLLKVVTSPSSKHGHQDQRDCLRGMEGCLYSRVRQCIRFMKCRERMASKTEWCLETDSDKLHPLSSRMYVFTRVASPAPLYPAPLPADVCKCYMDAIAVQTHRDSKTAHAHRRKTVV